MSNLVEHANRELRLADLFDEDSDYSGMLAEAVVELIEKFAEQGHSGGSAHMTRDLFNRLSNFQNLTPLTNDPGEWMDVSEMGADGSPPCWQNRRCSEAFSHDGGKTYYRLSEVEDHIRCAKCEDGPSFTMSHPAKLEVNDVKPCECGSTEFKVVKEGKLRSDTHTAVEARPKEVQ